MTREKAIEFGNMWLEMNDACKDSSTYKFFQLAIKALDQVDILDKIRVELHATAEMHNDGDYYLRDKWIDEIIDKYRTEVGKQYEHSCCYWENNECILDKDYCPDDYRCDSFD